MSFLDVRVLRFDERIEIKNKEVTSDNPNGKNGIVIMRDKFNTRWFDKMIIDNPQELALFKNAKPFDFSDVQVHIKCDQDYANKIYHHIEENSIITAKKETLENGYTHMIFDVDGNIAYHNTCSGCFENFFLPNDGLFKYAFIKYINEETGMVVGINDGKIENVFTHKVYGEIEDERHYKNSSTNISMDEVGIKDFYEMIVEDIKKNKEDVDLSIKTFEDIKSFIKMSEHCYDMDFASKNGLKNVKFYKLYDKMYKKGKATLVPGEDSKFIGYYLSGTAKVMWGCPPCMTDYINTPEIFLFKERTGEFEFPELEVKPIRKRGIVGNEFVLTRNNNVDEPWLSYISKDGDVINLATEYTIIMVQ
jgi:hypothetical protein